MVAWSHSTTMERDRCAAGLPQWPHSRTLHTEAHHPLDGESRREAPVAALSLTCARVTGCIVWQREGTAEHGPIAVRSHLRHKLACHDASKRSAGAGLPSIVTLRV